jgi:hypothetical protein
MRPLAIRGQALGMIALAPGLTTVVVDIVCWAGLTALAQGVMWLVAGPATADQLALRPWERAEPSAAHSATPIALLIPSSTLDQLRARRARRRPAPAVSSDRPILTTFELAMRAGELDPQETAATFCEDMDRLQVEVEDEYDAFLLDPGMGPMTYLTSDGRVLRDFRTWNGEGIQFETSVDGVIPALVVGA